MVHDGGKWLCGLQEVHKLRSHSSIIEPVYYGAGRAHYDDADTRAPCIVYSMGSNNEFSFERRVRKIAPGCEIHTFDPTVKETGDGKATYDRYHGDFGFGGTDGVTNTIGTRQFPIKSIATIMSELKHSHVDYLKVDVEGFEWEFLSKVDWSVTKVGQILVELHPQLGRGGRALTAKDVDIVFTKLEKAGYRLISLEPVTYRNWGQVELVFIRKDWQPSGNW
jgi:FkbM family methyltransferase